MRLLPNQAMDNNTEVVILKIVISVGMLTMEHSNTTG